jgi:hypothetical protein
MWLDLKKGLRVRAHTVRYRHRYVMRCLGVPVHVINICREIYTDSTQKSSQTLVQPHLSTPTGHKTGLPAEPPPLQTSVGGRNQTPHHIRGLQVCWGSQGMLFGVC